MDSDDKPVGQNPQPQGRAEIIGPGQCGISRFLYCL
jgi:hypothetical protein